MSIYYEGSAFFLNLIQGTNSLDGVNLFDEIYRDYLNNLPDEDIGNTDRFINRFGKVSYIHDYRYEKHKATTITSNNFIDFLYERVDKEKKELRRQILTGINNKSSPKDTLDYLRFKLKIIYNLILECHDNHVISHYSTYIINSLKEVGNHYIKLYKSDFSVNDYQYFYECFNDQNNDIQDTSGGDNKSYFTFRQHKHYTVQKDKYIDDLEALYYILHTNKFIHIDTKVSQFLNVFGMKKDMETKKIDKIIWISANGSLRKLIQELYASNFIYTLGKQWEVTGYCFCGINSDNEIISFEITDSYNPIGGSKDSKEVDRLGIIIHDFLKDIRQQKK